MGGRRDRDLTTTSYALLAQLSLRPWSTYELARQKVRYFRYVWPRAESAIYREVKHLAAESLVSAERQHTGRRARTVYSITDAGLDRLKTWLGTPVSPFAMEFEGMIRLFAAQSGSTEQLVTALEQVRADALDMLGFAGEVKLEYLEGRGVLQDQVYIRAHAIDFFVSLLNMMVDWTDRTLDEAEQWGDRSIAERNAQAMEVLARVAVATPDSPGTSTPVAPSRLANRRR